MNTFPRSRKWVNSAAAALIARDGKILLCKGYGFADVEKRIAYTPETVQNVASITKMFTAMTALVLRNEGKLRLESSICSYIDDCPDAWRPITVLNLIHHTSGIPDDEMDMGSEAYFQFMKQKDPVGRLIDDAKKKPLEFKPGQKFSYSNLGYVVLSQIIQKISRIPFSQVVDRKTLKPAGLRSTTFPEETEKKLNVAEGYTYGDLGWDKILGGFSLTSGHLRKLPHLPVNRPTGSGGISSTVDDLYRWSRSMDGSRFAPSQTINEVFTPGMGNYGDGWFIDRAFDRKRFRHNGINPGYLTEFIKFPDDKVTIILFSNIDRARMSVVVRNLSAIVFGMPYDLPVQGTTASYPRTGGCRLVGDYKMPNGKIINISQGEKLLTASVKDQYSAGLIPLSPTEFYFPLEDGKVTFDIGPNNKAIKINLHFEGEDHSAERISP